MTLDAYDIAFTLRGADASPRVVDAFARTLASQHPYFDAERFVSDASAQPEDDA